MIDCCRIENWCSSQYCLRTENGQAAAWEVYFIQHRYEQRPGRTIKDKALVVNLRSSSVSTSSLWQASHSTKSHSTGEHTRARSVTCPGWRSARHLWTTTALLLKSPSDGRNASRSVDHLLSTSLLRHDPDLVLHGNSLALYRNCSQPVETRQ